MPRARASLATDVCVVLAGRGLAWVEDAGECKGSFPFGNNNKKGKSKSGDLGEAMLEVGLNLVAEGGIEPPTYGL